MGCKAPTVTVVRRAMGVSVRAILVVRDPL